MGEYYKYHNMQITKMHPYSLIALAAMKRHLTRSPILFFLSLLIIPFSTMAQPLKTVPYVDLNRYAGLWYEIASYPQRFQQGCHRTTAEYTLSDKGYVIVENRCNRDSVDGKQSYIRGKAFVQKNSGNARLKVQFFWPFRGDYYNGPQK